MNANVTRMTFQEPYAADWSIRVECLPVFNEDPVAWFWDSIDPDRIKDRAWLDAEAPGWGTEIVRRGVREIELPIGRDATGTFLRYDVVLTFVDPAHRAAWIARREAMIREYREKREHAERRRVEAPEGAETCFECGCVMEPFVREETSRVAQFAFVHPLRGHRCPECGGESFRMGDGEALFEAMEAAHSRVGLPDWEDPAWTEGHGAEWRRRRKAAPEIVVHVEEGMDAAAILAQLDAALASACRPPRGVPLRAVG